MPDLMQRVCDTHPELTVCASMAPPPDVHHVMDQTYANAVLWLGGLGADQFWMLIAVVLGCSVVLPMLTLWTGHVGQSKRSSG